MGTELSNRPDQQPLLFGIISPQMLSEIDTDKMQNLLDMKMKLDALEAEKDFNKAMAKFQGEMPPVFKWREEDKGKYNYAAYEDIMRIARPFLKKNKLSISFNQSETETSLKMVCRVAHAGGHSMETSFTLPKDGPIQTRDGRNVTSQAQAQGSSNSYAKRYCLCNALDIVVTDEDDDGAAGQNDFLNESQQSEIMEVLDKFKNRESVLSGLLGWKRVPSISDIRAAEYPEVIKGLKAKLQAESK